MAQRDAEAHSITIRAPLTFSVTATTDRVELAVASWDVFDLVALQLVLLVQRVGLRNVRACPDCRRVFVKTYRRTFCSKRCQKRAQQRRLRQKEREQLAREQAHREREREHRQGQVARGRPHRKGL